ELELAGRARRRPANVSLVQPGRDRARDRDADRSLRVRQGSAAAYVQERGVAARLAGLGCAGRGDRVSGAVAPAAPRRACRDHPRRRDAAAVEAARRLRRGRSAEARRAGRPRLARDGRALARVERDARGEEMSAMRVFLSYGFRPFFLLCGAWAIVPLAVLVAALLGMPWNAEALPLFRGHGHEMIFGFVAAAIAGFLLTASATWTGTPPIAGGRLAALALLWLAGRFVVSPMTGLHSTAAVLVEIAFLPVLGAMLAVPLVRTRNVRNYPFLVILALLAAADALFHAIALGLVPPLPFDPLRFAANLVMLIVAIVGGRIVPAFTRNALIRSGRDSSIAPSPRLDLAVRLAIVAAAASAVLVAAQLARWEGFKTIRMPIVFVLHVGYAWIAIALALKALWILAGAPWAVNWLHAQTAGLFGTMILAVATRVALGHTGRPLVVRPAITVAYALVAAAALVRIFGPAPLPPRAVHVLACAAVLWAAAFGIFLVVYVPILFAPRAA